MLSRFTDEGEVLLWLEHQMPKASNEDPFVKIFVKDSGIGMSNSFINEKLFMKFEQESEGLDRNYEGSGLGLSVVKRVVELLEGDITVRSIPGVGTVFQLTFVLEEMISDPMINS